MSDLEAIWYVIVFANEEERETATRWALGCVSEKYRRQGWAGLSIPALYNAKGELTELEWTPDEIDKALSDLAQKHYDEQFALWRKLTGNGEALA
jgi:hypothetical protein